MIEQIRRNYIMEEMLKKLDIKLKPIDDKLTQIIKLISKEINHGK